MSAGTTSSLPGATPTSGVDLARRLNASGLRLRKRKHDRGVARQLDVGFPNGSSDVDLVASSVPVDERRVFAAMVFVRDSRGDFAAVHSVRRAEWGSPGGWREPDESPVDNAVRETERGDRAASRAGTRIRLAATSDSRPAPTTTSSTSPSPTSRSSAPSSRDARPSLTNGDDGIHATRWVTPQEYAALCGHLFWWPLAAEVFPDLRGLVRGP